MKRFYSSQRADGRSCRQRLGISSLGKFVAICICSLVIVLTFWRSDALAEVLFDPSSGSYFELFTDSRAFKGGQWLSARDFAQKRFYKRIRGRLAVIKTRQTHEFIQKNFHFKSEVWIGLRYVCSNASLVWVTGERVNRSSDFQAWHKQWRRAGESHTCGASKNGLRNSEIFMPIYYTRGGGRSLWQASGPKKGFEWFLIEYPRQ